METDYPDMNRFGSYFQYKKCVYPTVQEIDFETPYWENPVLKSFLWKFVALPFLPENKTMDRLQEFLYNSKTAFFFPGSFRIFAILLSYMAGNVSDENLESLQQAVQSANNQAL